MLTSSEWAENSQVFASNISINSMNFIYVCLITAILILIHSAYINKLQMSTIRFWTDGSCWSTVFASTFLIMDSRYSNTINDAFLIDLCVYAIFGTTVQLCDNYMTFTRYLLAYPKSTQRFKVLVNLYIWLFLISTYVPYETILPCFVDTNSDMVAAANTITAGYIFMTSYLSFNLFFSYQFWRAMRTKNTFGGGSNRKLLILGVKNLAHIFISSVGVILQGIEFTYGFSPGGCMASFFTVNIALHFLFNWKIEKSKIPFIPGYLRSRGSVIVQPQSETPVALRTNRRLGSMFMSRQQDGLSSSMDVPPSRNPSTSTNRASKTFSMFLGGVSVRYDGIGGSQRAGAGVGGTPAVNQSSHELDNDSNDIIHTLSKDSPNHANTTIAFTMDKVMRQTSRDSYRAKDKNHIFRNSIKEEDEVSAFDEKVDIEFDPKGTSGNLKRTMSLVLSNLFTHKIHVDNNNLVNQYSSPNNNNNNNNNNNMSGHKQARYSLSAISTGTSFKKKDLDTSSGHSTVKVVKVIERKDSV